MCSGLTIIGHFSRYGTYYTVGWFVFENFWKKDILKCLSTSVGKVCRRGSEFDWKTEHKMIDFDIKMMKLGWVVPNLYAFQCWPFRKFRGFWGKIFHQNIFWTPKYFYPKISQFNNILIMLWFESLWNFGRLSSKNRFFFQYFG